MVYFTAGTISGIFSFQDFPMIKETQYFERDVQYVEVNFTDVQATRNGSELSIKVISLNVYL